MGLLDYQGRVFRRGAWLPDGLHRARPCRGGAGPGQPGPVLDFYTSPMTDSTAAAGSPAHSDALADLFDRNRRWASETEAQRPGFFAALAEQQTPGLLWIGCADSRVPANQIVGLEPGEVFVHRNVANLVQPTDLNMLTVVSYAVEVLKISQIVICGHYGCGGVGAVVHGPRQGMPADWLQQIQVTSERHAEQLGALPLDERGSRLCELNVIEQVTNLAGTSVIREAWERGQAVTLHGWVYGLHDGLIRDLSMTASTPGEVRERYTSAIVASVDGS